MRTPLQHLNHRLPESTETLRREDRSGVGPAPLQIRHNTISEIVFAMHYRTHDQNVSISRSLSGCSRIDDPANSATKADAWICTRTKDQGDVRRSAPDRGRFVVSGLATLAEGWLLEVHCAASPRSAWTKRSTFFQALVSQRRAHEKSHRNGWLFLSVPNCPGWDAANN
jgi:hypothetical protein